MVQRNVCQPLQVWQFLKTWRKWWKSWNLKGTVNQCFSSTSDTELSSPPPMRYRRSQGHRQPTLIRKEQIWKITVVKQWEFRYSFGLVWSATYEDSLECEVGCESRYTEPARSRIDDVECEGDRRENDLEGELKNVDEIVAVPVDEKLTVNVPEPFGPLH